MNFNSKGTKMKKSVTRQFAFGIVLMLASMFSSPYCAAQGGGGGGGGFFAAGGGLGGGGLGEGLSGGLASVAPSPNFQQKMRGVVRLTYVLKISSVIAHVKSGAAVVLTSDSSKNKVGTPVLATSASLFDTPDEEWYINAPQDSLSHEIYVQDVIETENSGEVTSLRISYSGGMGGMGGGAMVGMAPAAMGGAAVGFGFGTSLPDFNHPLYSFGSYSSLDALRTNVDQLAIVFGQKSNVRLEEISLLVKSKEKQAFNPAMAEAYSLADSPVPKPTENSTSEETQFMVGERGFLALVLHDKNLKTSYSPPVGLLNAYWKATKLRSDAMEQSFVQIQDVGGGKPAVEEGATNKSKPLVDALTAFKRADTPESKKLAISQMEQLLASQFDAQRSVKQLEIGELRGRLEEIEKQEETRIAQKTEIVAERLKQLIGEPK